MNSNLETRNYKLKTKGGFSVIELLVISAIIATFSVVLILNFRSSPTNKTARNQTASVIMSDIRRAQSMALAGSRYQGNLTCGYGVHKVDNITYLIYAKAVPASTPCSSIATRNYQGGTSCQTEADCVVEIRKIINQNMEIRPSPPVKDVFFEPPDPKTYINNNSSLGGSTTITIQLKNQQNCAQQSCTDIKVYTSGQIDLIN